MVLDASAFDVLKETSPRSAGVQLRAWIVDGHGRVAYSTYDEVGRQLTDDPKVFQLVLSYHQSGLAALMEDTAILRAASRLDALETRSGERDKQVLALAAASEAQVMVVRDKNLRKDFEDAKMLPPLRGVRRRAYPVDQRPARRNDFLHRRRCPRRLARLAGAEGDHAEATDRSWE